MREKRSIVFAAAVLIGGATGTLAQSGPVDQGRAIAERQCARCHAVDVHDASKLPIAPPLRDIAKRYPPQSLAEALAEGIVTGHKGMPEFSFTPQEIGALIAHLEVLRRGR